MKHVWISSHINRIFIFFLNSRELSSVLFQWFLKLSFNIWHKHALRFCCLYLFLFLYVLSRPGSFLHFLRNESFLGSSKRVVLWVCFASCCVFSLFFDLICSWTGKLFWELFVFESFVSCDECIWLFLLFFNCFHPNIRPRACSFRCLRLWCKSLHCRAKELIFLRDLFRQKRGNRFRCLVIARTWSDILIFIRARDLIEDWLLYWRVFSELLLLSRCSDGAGVTQTCYAFCLGLANWARSRNIWSKHWTLLVFVNWLIFLNFVSSRA